MKKKYIIPQTKVTKLTYQPVMVSASVSNDENTGAFDAKDQLDFDMDDVLKDWEW